MVLLVASRQWLVTKIIAGWSSSSSSGSIGLAKQKRLVDNLSKSVKSFRIVE